MKNLTVACRLFFSFWKFLCFFRAFVITCRFILYKTILSLYPHPRLFNSFCPFGGCWMLQLFFPWFSNFSPYFYWKCSLSFLIYTRHWHFPSIFHWVQQWHDQILSSPHPVTLINAWLLDASFDQHHEARHATLQIHSVFVRSLHFKST